MPLRIGLTFACTLAGAVILAGCTAGAGAPAGARSHPQRIAHPAAGSTAKRPPRPVTMADARRCPKTIPRDVPPPGIQPDAFFGWPRSVGNGRLWVGDLGPGGVIVASGDSIQADGSVRWKISWWRKVHGILSITGRRLDSPAPPVTADSFGYGDFGFNASSVDFPTEGCWRVTGTVDGTSLTFVTFVIKQRT